MKRVRWYRLSRRPTHLRLSLDDVYAGGGCDLRVPSHGRRFLVRSETPALLWVYNGRDNQRLKILLTVATNGGCASITQSPSRCALPQSQTETFRTRINIGSHATLPTLLHGDLTVTQW